MSGSITIRREVFWDIKESEIPKAWIEAPDWVVVRVFEYGFVIEILDIVDYFGVESVRNILKKAEAQLRPMGKAMAKLFLD